MPDGIVWFRYAALLDVLREASNRDPYVLALAVDTVKMNDLVYTVLMSFKDDCFIWFMPKKGYLGCKCTVTDNRGNATETYLTPVKASWFNQLPSTFERQKTYKLLQAVAKVELAYGAKI